MARWAAALLLAAGWPGPARGFDGQGHVVIEALAYRTLVEGHDGAPPRPDVLRDLFDDGALDPPWCFGWGAEVPSDCRDARTENPLLCWPHPQADRPDAFFRRQFSDAGQCFHFMGTLADALTDPLPGTEVPRGLATRAVVRCSDLLDGLLRQVVVDGGPGTRRSGYGLYELVHAVEDSFSGSHTQRAPGGIDHLLVWKPIEKVARLPTEAATRIPDGVFHVWDDHRDKTYVREGGPAACERRVAHPYDVPYECLSAEGDAARRAVAELLALVRDLRRAELAAPGVDTHPEASAEWRAYRARWFTPVHACEGEECEARQPRDAPPGRYAFLGLETRYSPSADTLDLTARGALYRYAEELNPFLYALTASAGYRQQGGVGGSALLGVGLDLLLPLGFKAFLSATPAELSATVGAASGVQLVTRLLRLEYALGDRFLLSAEAPLQVSWVRPRADWSFAVGFSYGLSSPRLAGADALVRHQDRPERGDASWDPPAAPYGRLHGRVTAVHLFAGVSIAAAPEVAYANRAYGLGTAGAELSWDHDRWGGGFAFTPVLSLAGGVRTTTGDSMYLTATLAAGVRWYFLGPLSLSVAVLRLEGGPKVRGQGEVDGTTGVRGAPGSEYYLLAGSRLGLGLRLGMFELLVESPTVAWASDPFGTGEILSFRLGVRLR